MNKPCFQIDAGIKYLQIETEVKDDPNTRQIAWFLTPDHGTDSWQVGRVNLHRGQQYKIVITTKRSNIGLGYVAIDDFEFKFNPEECTILPNFAKPTTTTTTPPTTPNPEDIVDCNFEDVNLCGWSIDQELNETDRFHFERRNGNEIPLGLLPTADHNNDKNGQEFKLFYTSSIK